MNIPARTTLWTAAAVGVLFGLAFSAPASAQEYPTRPVRLVVPNPPGGAIDMLARLLSQKLNAIWGQPVIVEYKPGANTRVGTDYVAKSAPDGYTLGMVVASHVINPSIRSNMPYDTLKDLSGVTFTAFTTLLISASPSVEANSIAELVALAKRNPGKLSYATPGSGSAPHLAGELLKLMTGIDIVHVPYKGSAGAYPDVISGRVQLIFDPIIGTMPHVKAGKLKPLAVTSPKRWPSAPDIPAVAETVPGFSVASLNGIVVPSATPRELVRRISGDFAVALNAPEFKARLNELGLEPVGNTPEEFDAFIRTEIEKWARVVKTANLTVD
jgi:tripartite-type tricarboxylate transporter receptor subunit TctC